MGFTSGPWESHEPVRQAGRVGQRVDSRSGPGGEYRYTPFALVGLRGGLGRSLFGVIWGLAMAGVIFKLFFTGRFDLLSTATYLGMGWLAIVAIEPMLRRLAPSTLAWIVAGGILYTAGTWFYHSDRIPFAHAIWHTFVIGGSACHMIAVGTQL